jgi:hypothetical protein
VPPSTSKCSSKAWFGLICKDGHNKSGTSSKTENLAAMVTERMEM